VGRRTCEVGERRYRRAYKHRLDKYRNGGIVVTALPRGRGIHRIEFFAITSLIIQLSVLAWCAGQLSPHEAKAPMVGWDFVVFWSAARVALEHGAAMVFSPELLRAMEASVTNWVDVAPWPYPPTFLLAVIPIGWLSFLTALAVFSAVGFTLYALMLARIGRGLDRIHFLFAAAFPGVGVALAAGQNSLITVAAAGGALALLRSNAMLAGACIAALAIKPQFAVLFPLALVCGRQWKAFAAAAVCALSFVAVATFVLGREAWITFATHLPVFNYLFVENGGQACQPCLPRPGSPGGVHYRGLCGPGACGHSHGRCDGIFLAEGREVRTARISTHHQHAARAAIFHVLRPRVARDTDRLFDARRESG
jgi:Glycosyltransferase family 87